MLGTVGITWYLRTKDMNFFPDDTIEEAAPIEQKPYELTGPPAPIQLSSADIAPDSFIPALSHFAEDRENPDKLSRIFAVLKAESNFELAYLAGERMLESTKLTESDKREYAKQMTSLISVIEPYVFDVHEARELQITLAGIPTESQQAISDNLTKLVNQSSGGLTTLLITHTKGDPALTVSVGQSQPFTPLPENANFTEIVSRLYILLVTEMNKNDVSIPLWQGTTPQEFTVVLTRSSWAQLLPEEKPEAQPEPEE